MNKVLTIILVLALTTAAAAQSPGFIISGRVVDEATKAPLQAASVFAQNTTFGTTTDAVGNFTLRLPNGGYDLALTFTGYETFTLRISTTQGDAQPLLVELKPRNKAMEAVAVVGSNEVKDGWEKYGSFFTDNFIGKTAFSAACTLVNKEALKFYFSKRRNRLKVLAAAPLEIRNEALGYTIRYTLDSFVYEYGTQISLYTGYPLFEPLAPANDAQQQLWMANRLLAYNGSILHFMRSLFTRQLKEQGFEIQFLVTHADKETAIPVKDYYSALNYSKTDSLALADITPNQQNLAVLYTREKPGADYLAQAGDDVPKAFQFSFLTFLPQGSLSIEQNGFYYNQDEVAVNGYWTWEKVADMLPYDYKP